MPISPVCSRPSTPISLSLPANSVAMTDGEQPVDSNNALVKPKSSSSLPSSQKRPFSTLEFSPQQSPQSEPLSRPETSSLSSEVSEMTDSGQSSATSSVETKSSNNERNNERNNKGNNKGDKERIENASASDAMSKHCHRLELIEGLRTSTETVTGLRYYFVDPQWWALFTCGEDVANIPPVQILSDPNDSKIEIPETAFQLLSLWYGVAGNDVASYPLVNMKTPQSPQYVVYTKPVIVVEAFTLGFKAPYGKDKNIFTVASDLSVMNLAAQLGSTKQWKLWQLSQRVSMFPYELSIGRFNMLRQKKKLIAASGSVAPSATLSSILYSPPQDGKIQLIIEEITPHGTWLSSDDGKTRGTIGLTNLGNTCYMNSALQCLSHIEELAAYFLTSEYKNDINPDNPIGCGGNVALVYGKFLRNLFYGTVRPYSPSEFRYTVGRYNAAFSGYAQQDSQEFVAFLLDSLHEDLNRIKQKPATEKPELPEDKVNDSEAISRLARECWNIHKMRNDSVILDLFTGLYRSTLVCPVCKKISITFDPFMDLTLPIPNDNLWFKDIHIMRLNGKSQEIKVAIDKFATIRQLKEYLVTKVYGLDPNNLICSDIYNNRFYQHLEDRAIVSDQIQANDTIVMNELSESVPGELSEEKFVIPVFHRLVSSSSSDKRHGARYDSGGLFFGTPFFVILTRHEAIDAGAILSKVYERYRDLVPSIGEDDFHINVASQKRNKQISPGKEGIMTGWGLTKDNIKPLITHMPVNMGVAERTEDQGDELASETSSDDFVNVTSDARVDSVYTSGSTNFLTPERTPMDICAAASTDSGLACPVMTPVVMPHSMDVDTEPENNSSSSADELIGPLGRLPSLPWVTSELSLADLPHNERRDGLLVRPGEGLVCDFQEEPDSRIWEFERIVNPEVSRLLESQQQQRTIPLDACLDLFSRTEVLGENDLWYCSRCQELRQATKTIELWKVPDILTIHLKRFSSSRNFSDKISDVIEFPIENLDMTDRIGDKSNHKPLIYDLIGVDNHFGRLGGGHYSAHAKNFVDGKWYYFDDTSCRPESPEKAITGAAYLLFYRRRSSKPLGGERLEKAVLSLRETLKSGDELIMEDESIVSNDTKRGLVDRSTSNNVVAAPPAYEGWVLGRGSSSTAGPIWASAQLNLDDEEQEDEELPLSNDEMEGMSDDSTRQVKDDSDYEQESNNEFDD